MKTHSFLLLLVLTFTAPLLSQTQVGTDIDGEAEYDYSGRSVSLSASGNRVAIGAASNEPAGHVRVYDLQGGDWVQVGSDIVGEEAGDKSGASVSLNASGNRVAIGATLNDGAGDHAGHVRVYDLQGGDWIQVGSDIDGESAGDNLGGSLSLSSSGSRVAIGARGNDEVGSNSGHVRMYDLQGGDWIQIGSDIDGEAAGDNSGRSVSLSASGNRVAIGATGNDGAGSNSGHVRVYELLGGDWVKIGLDINGETAGDNSGSSMLSADGNRVAIGAFWNDDNGNNAGHVRVYEKFFSLAIYENNSACIGVDNGSIQIFSNNLGNPFTYSYELFDASGIVINVGDFETADFTIDNLSPGVYEFKILDATSAVVHQESITVTEVPGIIFEEMLTACEGETVTVFGMSIMENSELSESYTSYQGCDSTHFVNVLFSENTTTEEMLMACHGETVTVFGMSITETSELSESYTSYLGCDSTHTVNVLFYENITTEEVLTACDGETVPVFGMPVTEPSELSESYTSYQGCDSTHTVSVLFNENVTTQEILTACEGETVTIFGIPVTETSELSENYTSFHGCDSTHTVSVLFNENITTEEVLTACDGDTVIVFGMPVTESSELSEIYTSYLGCDSTHNVNVLFNQEIMFTLVNTGNEFNGSSDGFFEINIVGGMQPYQTLWTLNGMSISTDEDPTGLVAGTYNLMITDATGCVLSITDGLIIQNTTATSQKYLTEGLKLFPNPANDFIYLFLETKVTEDLEIILFDINGKIVDPNTVNIEENQRWELNIKDLAAGVYAVQIKGDDFIYWNKFVKVNK